MTIRKPIAIALTAFVCLFAPVVAMAANAGLNTPPSGTTGNAGLNTPPAATTQSSGTLLNPLKAGTSIPALLADILQIVIQVGSVVVVLMIVYTGFKYVMARGNPGEVGKAHEMLKWTVIGALVLLGSQAIASAIQATVTALGG